MMNIVSKQIPRKFKLLEEYENSMHRLGDSSCSNGSEDRF